MRFVNPFAAWPTTLAASLLACLAVTAPAVAQQAATEPVAAQAENTSDATSAESVLRTPASEAAQMSDTQRPNGSISATPAALTLAPTLAPTPAAATLGPTREHQRGYASWYGPGFHGKLTASGQRYDMHAMTAAHRTLPFGTMVLVKSLLTGREVLVRITDRGPFVAGRVLDLSRAAAVDLGMLAVGLNQVALLIQDPAPRAATAAKAKQSALRLQR